jgi:hypothetical protein
MGYKYVAPTELVAFWGCGLQICRFSGAPTEVLLLRVRNHIGG